MDSIEPFHLAAHGRTLDGRFEIQALERLRPLLRSAGGEVRYALTFDRDEAGFPCVTGRVESDLMLQCQRCMQDMPYSLSSTVHLGIVRTREAAEQLPTNYEPLLVTEGETTLSGIVEDEVILALPIVAMHRPQDCAIDESIIHPEGQDDAVADTTSRRQNPFAVLETLKHDLNSDRTSQRAIDDED